MWAKQVTSINQARMDSVKLVQERQELAGVMPVAGFARLTESLLHSGGVLNYRVAGTVDGQQRPLLKLQVSGTLQLQCQRCLNGLAFALTIDTALRLVAEEALDSAYDDDPNAPDCVASSTAFDLAALIEDEVLLALPAYPRHEAGTCGGIANGAANAPGTQTTAFSALQALKQKHIQSKE